jgi:hypothetical protein
MGVINNYLDEYIREIVSNYRSIICEVIEKNADGGSFDVRPVNNDPIIYDVIIFKSKIVNSEPAIGSYCIVSFLDDMNAYISYMFDFKTNVIDSKETTVVRSDGLIIEQAKNMLTVIRANEDDNKLQEYINQVNNDSGSIFTYCDKMYSYIEENFSIVSSKADKPELNSTLSIDNNSIILETNGDKKSSFTLLEGDAQIETDTSFHIKSKSTIIDSGEFESILLTESQFTAGKYIPNSFKLDSGIVQKGSGIDLKYNLGVNSIMSDLLQIMPILTALDAALLSGANAPIISALTTRLGQNISLTQ